MTRRPDPPGPERRRILLAALLQPGKAARVAMALALGWWYKLTAPLRGIRFRAGRRLMVFGRIKFQGPGEVVFGNHVRVIGRATPWTYDREARILIGDNVIMSGTRFGCAREITVGDDSLLAHASIMDTDFHSTRTDRRSPDAPVRVEPVRIGRNVWIAEQAGILPGTVIGDNSVVAFGAVCSREYPANAVIAGNPARVAMPVPEPARASEPASPSPKQVPA